MAISHGESPRLRRESGGATGGCGRRHHPGEYGGRRAPPRPGAPTTGGTGPTAPGSRSAAANAAASAYRSAGSLASAAPGHRGEVGRDAVGQRRDRLAHVGQRGGDRAVGDERPAAGEALEEHHAEGVDVAGGGGGPALGLLGREVLRGAHHLAGLGQRHALGRAGDAEVGDLDDAVGGDHQVGGLDVAVHDAGGVRGGRRASAAWARRSRACSGGIGCPGRSRSRQRLAVDELHDQVGRGARTGRPRARRSRRPTRCRGGAATAALPRLGLEAGAEAGVVGELVLEQLDRDRCGRGWCRWPATPRPCRRWRSGSRGGSGRPSSANVSRRGSLVDHRLHDRLGDRAGRAGRRRSRRGRCRRSGSSPRRRPAGCRPGRSETNQAYGVAVRRAGLGGAGLAGDLDARGCAAGVPVPLATTETIISLQLAGRWRELIASDSASGLGLVEDVEVGRAGPRRRGTASSPCRRWRSRPATIAICSGVARHVVLADAG